MEQLQRRPATARHQVDRRTSGLDLPLFEAGKKSGIVSSILSLSSQCLQSVGNFQAAPRVLG